MRGAGCKLAIMTGAAGHDDGNMSNGLDNLTRVCHTCEEGGLHYTLSQYFGEPGETRETVEEKLAFLRSVSPAVASLRVGIRVLPGSPVVQAALEEGLIAGEGDLLRPVFYLADEVKDWITDRLKEEAAANPRWNLM
jgi:hypothetical protein